MSETEQEICSECDHPTRAHASSCSIGHGITPEISPSPEAAEASNEQKKILRAATRFAEYLTVKWPQIERPKRLMVQTSDDESEVALPELPEGIQAESKLNYCISGSLATMLLSRAEVLTELEEHSIPDVIVAGARIIPESARLILATLARPMGDLDYVPTDQYKMNSRRLKKGGGGPSFDEIPQDARLALKRGGGQLKVMCDPVESYGAKTIARIEVDGKDYYIPRPDRILAYKVLHILQNYQQKFDTFNADFGKLYEAVRAIYTEKELTDAIQRVLGDYDAAMEAIYYRMNAEQKDVRPYVPKVPMFAEKVLAHPKLSSEIKSVIEQVVV